MTFYVTLILVRTISLFLNVDKVHYLIMHSFKTELFNISNVLISVGSTFKMLALLGDNYVLMFAGNNDLICFVTALALASFECEGPDNSYEKERYKTLK